jgi:GH35 family endo-1,4-beta-xylanase
VCWRCMLKNKIYVIKCRIQRKIKQRKQYRKMIKQLKAKGIPITKTTKELTKKICQ